MDGSGKETQFFFAAFPPCGILYTTYTDWQLVFLFCELSCKWSELYIFRRGQKKEGVESHIRCMRRELFGPSPS